MLLSQHFLNRFSAAFEESHNIEKATHIPYSTTLFIHKKATSAVQSEKYFLLMYADL